MIAPAADSLKCQDCHTQESGRIDFVALGYSVDEAERLTNFPPALEIELNQAANRAAWQQHDELISWLARSRLDQFTMMALRAVSEGDQAKLNLLERHRRAIPPAVGNMAAMVAAGKGRRDADSPAP